MKTPAGIEVFTGFDIQYPEYEVITPQGKQHYTLRTMTVGEEAVLKGSMMSPITVAEHLAEVIWKCIVKKPEGINTFEDFINNTTIKDRDALVIGLHLITYGDIEKYAVTCDQCQNVTNVKINIDKSMKFKVWDKDDSCIAHREEVPLQVFKGVSAVVKCPTMADEIKVNKKSAHVSETLAATMMNLLMVDKFKIEPSEKRPNGDEITERDNILAAYNSLPSKDMSLITECYQKTFNEYQITVECEVVCNKCGKASTVVIDLTQQFFRALYQ